MIRVGLKALAAVGACAAGFVAYLWLADDAGPAVAELRAQAGTFAAAAVTETPTRNSSFVSRQADARLIAPQGISSERMSPTVSFADRFAVDRSVSSAAPSASFADRFSGDRLPSWAPVPSAAAAARPTGAAAPRGTARAAVAKTVDKSGDKGRAEASSEIRLPACQRVGDARCTGLRARRFCRRRRDARRSERFDAERPAR